MSRSHLGLAALGLAFPTLLLEAESLKRAFSRAWCPTLLHSCTLEACTVQVTYCRLGAACKVPSNSALRAFALHRAGKSGPISQLWVFPRWEMGPQLSATPWGGGMEKRLPVMGRDPGLASSAPHLPASQQPDSVICGTKVRGNEGTASGYFPPFPQFPSA